MNENYEDYEENLTTDDYDDEEYEDENQDKSSRNKKILLIALVVVAIIIIILLLKACTGGTKAKKFDYEKTLLDAGKEYYEFNKTELPKAVSSCKTISLNKLVSEGLLDPDNYKDCDGDETLVKVCLIEEDKYHYVPLLTCENINSDDLYDKFEEGKISDIIPDETDIKYSYMGQILNSDTSSLGDIRELWYGEKIPFNNYKLLSRTTYYRYKELQYKWLESTKIYYPGNTVTPGNKLYIVSPKTGYDKKDNAQTASKWYTSVESGEKVYYSKVSSTAPDGYPHADKSTAIAVSSTVRTIKKEEAVSTYSALKMYTCAESKYKSRIDAGDTKDIVMSNEIYACGDPRNAHPEHDYQVKTFYSCDGGVNIVSNGTMCYTCKTSGAKLRPDNSSCVISYNEWQPQTESCTGLSDVCRSFSTVYFYKWYKYSSETRSYYPSKSTTAAGEKTYYVSSPVEGAKKDDSTTTTAWSWYQAGQTTTGNYMTNPPSEGAVKTGEGKWTDWSEWTTNATQAVSGSRSVETKEKLRIQEIKNTKPSEYEDIMEKYTENVEELFNAFKTRGHEVKSLEEIEMNGEIKYLVKMYIRNKK